jgi:hypothetical protein
MEKYCHRRLLQEPISYLNKPIYVLYFFACSSCALIDSLILLWE